MKSLYKFVLPIIAIPFISGCGDSFLDKQPSRYISSDRISELSKTMPELQEANVKGLYSTMYSVESGGLVGAQDDYGQKGLDVMIDMIAGDICKPNRGYGWYNELLSYNVTVDKSNLRNYMPWRYYYRIIFNANTVVDGLGGEDAKFEDNDSGTKSRHYLGQALGMRAYAYFYLAQLFSSEYQSEEPLVPIYISLKDTNKPVSPQKDVYKRIFSDLNKASELLKDFERSDKSQFNVDVANLYFAYTYAATGDYTNAEKYSKLLINGGKYSPMTPDEICYGKNADGSVHGTGFADVKTSGWIWGADITPDMGLDLISFWGQMDIFTYSYPSAGTPRCIDNGLFDKIRKDDVRKNQFSSFNFGDEKKPKIIDCIPYNKFYHPKREFGGQRQIDADYVYARISEMYLLNIESLARLNKEPEAKAELKKYLNGRIKDLTYIDALSSQSLLDEIYLQTRIEFWGEGKSYLALKRFKQTVTLGTNRFLLEGEKIPYNDKRMYFKIPENEELNNPFLYSKDKAK